MQIQKCAESNAKKIRNTKVNAAQYAAPDVMQQHKHFYCLAHLASSDLVRQTFCDPTTFLDGVKDVSHYATYAAATLLFSKFLCFFRGAPKKLRQI